MKKNNILFVYAHPDDETFASGITISKYTQENKAECHLLCATRGQAGKPGDPPLCSIEQLPAYREQELREAASLLGLASVKLWDYQDKLLNTVPVDELVKRIHQAIEVLQPAVLVTFAPHGISGHPDHQAISQATTKAVQTLGAETSVRKLYYATRPSNGPFGAIEPPFSDPIENITTIINAPEYKPQVAAALRAHKTQHLSVERVFPGVPSGGFDAVPPSNHYILAWHNLPSYSVSADKKEADLFEGMGV
ncbi:PIG-L deacetylase family protein [Brevibacillus parabrevis]|uniref:PIG-L domain-containing protein n=1 Tax=Brevibacillus parabrevis TaxID=54914 RepID=A0A4Y3PIR9_BREPA|nr:PIG-L deacetylase family protein [Brevibacillus parabrevis]RNB96324.1 PIG-L family deacetylase [Brevibacillus parabrevis]GEB32685.1 PIG-L domain-containing protein [Brevibacillus parabrevis]